MVWFGQSFRCTTTVRHSRGLMIDYQTLIQRQSSSFSPDTSQAPDDSAEFSADPLFGM